MDVFNSVLFFTNCVLVITTEHKTAKKNQRSSFCYFRIGVVHTVATRRILIYENVFPKTVI